MRSAHAARSADGRYSNFGLRAEESARNAKRMPTTSHDGRRSVGTHTGTLRLDAAMKDAKGHGHEKANSR